MVEFEQYKYEWNQYKDKVKELAASFDIETKENRITLITCVENMPEYRLCIQAEEIKKG